MMVAAESKEPTRKLIDEMLQPILQLLALSACSSYTSCTTPLILIFSSRLRYMPIVYFPEDVLLSLTGPLQYLGLDGSTYYEGMYLLYLLICVGKFDHDQLAGLTRSGWREALLSRNTLIKTRY